MADSTVREARKRNKPQDKVHENKHFRKPLPVLQVVKTGRSNADGGRYTEASKVYEKMKPMVSLDREHFHILHLDGKNRILADELVSMGTLNQAIIHPREVFKGAVNNGSAALICVHNHPTGDPSPSKEDKEITRRLRAVADIVGIPILDHIIVGENTFYSFAGHGWEGCPSVPWIEAGMAGEDAEASKGEKRDLEAEDRFENCRQKLDYLQWSFCVAIAGDEAIGDKALVGLGGILDDVQKVLADIKECHFYRKDENKEVSRTVQSPAAIVSSILHIPQAKGDFEVKAENYLKIKSEYPDHLLLFQIGDSFKFLDDDAVEVSRILKVDVCTFHEGGKDAAVCRIPFADKDSWIVRLVAAGKKVALCESVE